MSYASVELGPAPRGGLSLSGFRQRRLTIAVVVILLAIGYLVFSGIKSTTVYYLTVSELHAQKASLQGQPVRVAGKVVDGSIVRDTTDMTVRFMIYDDGGRLPVVHKGLVPDIFGEQVEVVVEGVYTGNEFHSTTLLAKCPSRFEGQLNNS